jgi:electron transfer flavoprotein beta subunit
LNIVVCTKQVPDSAATLKVDEQSNVSWGDAPLVINPWDEYAVEEALRLKEKHGGKVTVISMGPDACKEALKQAVAMGCDEAIQLWDAAFDGSDAPATALVLARAIDKIGGVDAVFFGKQAIDGDTGLVAPAVARRLGWPQLSFVAKIRDVDAAGRTITVERMLEEGRQVVSSILPAVVSVVKEINEPRYPSFMGIRKASKLQVPAWSAADLAVEPASVGRGAAAVQWTRIYAPPPREGAVEMIAGDTPEDIAAKLADKLMAEKVI